VAIATRVKALYNLLYPAHIATSSAVRLLGRQPFPDLFGRRQFQIGLELLIEVAIK
jgi:hypothetical protein